MNKLVLSGLVIISFIGYSLYGRRENKAVVLAPPAAITTPAPTATPDTLGTGGATPAPTPVQTSGQYKNGQYTGSPADAIYGNIQVKATISGGKITNVEFLQYPNDRRTSQQINSQAMPYLKQEAIQVQSAQVNIVSGATDTSEAFIESMGSALAQAKL